MSAPGDRTADGTAGEAVGDRVARLLAAVLERSPRSCAELGQQLGVTLAELAPALEMLERSALISLDAERTTVRPGPAALRFARSVPDPTQPADLIEVAQANLHRLADESGETVNLILPRPDGTEAVAQVDGSHMLGVANWVGRPLGLHSTAAGKVFLAFGVAQLPDGELEPLTAETITDRRQLEAELEQARERGYAMIIDELEPGLSAVGAPVHGHDGEVIAVLCASGATLRLPRARLELLGRVAAEQASEVSRRLGHPG
ncbi:MAG: IclR family transcriptional regulator [Solirubrobacteraceae bacterium]